MRVIRGLHNIAARDRGVAVSLGNYDGVHRGHQALFEEMATAFPGLRRCAVLFEPQPMEFLRPAQAPARLQSLSAKLRRLREINLDQVLVLRFDRDLSRMSAARFVREVLIQGLAVRQIVVGDDYRFGYQRQGNVDLLRSMAQEGGYAVDHLDTVVKDGQRISSTRIRQALRQGALDQAIDCLGRPYELRGRVVHGQKLGRELGAPTANVALRRPSPLRHGVYCVRLNGAAAVANIGVRPTIGGDQEHLEVHLLRGVHQLYGQMVSVTFERFLRPEKHFDDLDALKAAIGQDIRHAEQHFAQELA